MQDPNGLIDASSLFPDPNASASFGTKPDVDALIVKHATRHGVDPDMIRAMMHQESGGHGRAVSPKGASGYLQLMPDTARSLGVTDIFDPEQNIEAGIRYYKQQLDRFGSPELALAAYNAGPHRIKNGQIPQIAETQNYVRSIMGRYGKRGGSAPSGTGAIDASSIFPQPADSIDASALFAQPAESTVATDNPTGAESAQDTLELGSDPNANLAPNSLQGAFEDMAGNAGVNLYNRAVAEHNAKIGTGAPPIMTPAQAQRPSLPGPNGAELFGQFLADGAPPLDPNKAKLPAIEPADTVPAAEQKGDEFLRTIGGLSQDDLRLARKHGMLDRLGPAIIDAKTGQVRPMTEEEWAADKRNRTTKNEDGSTSIQGGYLRTNQAHYLKQIAQFKAMKPGIEDMDMLASASEAEAKGDPATAQRIRDGVAHRQDVRKTADVFRGMAERKWYETLSDADRARVDKAQKTGASLPVGLAAAHDDFVNQWSAYAQQPGIFDKLQTELTTAFHAAGDSDPVYQERQAALARNIAQGASAFLQGANGVFGSPADESDFYQGARHPENPHQNLDIANPFEDPQFLADAAGAVRDTAAGTAGSLTALKGPMELGGAAGKLASLSPAGQQVASALGLTAAHTVGDVAKQGATGRGLADISNSTVENLPFQAGKDIAMTVPAGKLAEAAAESGSFALPFAGAVANVPAQTVVNKLGPGGDNSIIDANTPMDIGFAGDIIGGGHREGKAMREHDAATPRGELSNELGQSGPDWRLLTNSKFDPQFHRELMADPTRAIENARTVGNAMEAAAKLMKAGADAKTAFEGAGIPGISPETLAHLDKIGADGVAKEAQRHLELAKDAEAEANTPEFHAARADAGEGDAANSRAATENALTDAQAAQQQALTAQAQAVDMHAHAQREHAAAREAALVKAANGGTLTTQDQLALAEHGKREVARAAELDQHADLVKQAGERVEDAEKTHQEALKAQEAALKEGTRLREAASKRRDEIAAEKEKAKEDAEKAKQVGSTAKKGVENEPAKAEGVEPRVKAEPTSKPSGSAKEQPTAADEAKGDEQPADAHSFPDIDNAPLRATAERYADAIAANHRATGAKVSPAAVRAHAVGLARLMHDTSKTTGIPVGRLETKVFTEKQYDKDGKLIGTRARNFSDALLGAAGVHYIAKGGEGFTPDVTEAEGYDPDPSKSKPQRINGAFKRSTGKIHIFGGADAGVVTHEFLHALMPHIAKADRDAIHAWAGEIAKRIQTSSHPDDVQFGKALGLLDEEGKPVPMSDVDMDEVRDELITHGFESMHESDDVPDGLTGSAREAFENLRDAFTHSIKIDAKHVKDSALEGYVKRAFYGAETAKAPADGNSAGAKPDTARLENQKQDTTKSKPAGVDKSGETPKPAPVNPRVEQRKAVQAAIEEAAGSPAVDGPDKAKHLDRLIAAPARILDALKPQPDMAKRATAAISAEATAREAFRALHPDATDEQFRSWLAKGIVTPENPHALDALTRAKSGEGRISDKRMKAINAKIAKKLGLDVENLSTSLADANAEVARLETLQKEGGPLYSRAKAAPIESAKQEENKEKFLGKSVEREPMYTGTTGDFNEFRTGTAGAIYVTKDPAFANKYTSRFDYNTDEVTRDGGNIMKVHVRAENPFEYGDKEHIRALFGQLKKQGLDEKTAGTMALKASQGRWDTIESPPVQRAIKALGHDSFRIQENGVDNLGVYKGEQLKSATGNSGAFSRGTKDIRFSRMAGFRSAVDEALDKPEGLRDLSRGRGEWATANIARRSLERAGVRKEELADLGIDDYLKERATNGGPVSLRDIQTLRDAHSAEVQIRTRVGAATEPVKWETNPNGSRSSEDELGSYVIVQGARDGRFHAMATVAMPEDGFSDSYDDDNTQSGIFDTQAAAEHFIEAVRHEAANAGSQNHGGDGLIFGNYTPPGSRNLKETVLHFPEKEKPQSYLDWQEATFGSREHKKALNSDALMEMRADYSKSQTAAREKSRRANYRGPHWPEPNVIAHIRQGDRTLPDGAEAREITEIQSDYHQKGAKEGYYDPNEPALGRGELVAKKVEDEWGDIHFEVRTADGRFVQNIVRPSIRTPEEAIAEAKKTAEKSPHMIPPPPGVPDGPMKNAWYKVGLKKAVADAIADGKDSVLLSTGRTISHALSMDAKQGKGNAQWYDGTYKDFLAGYFKQHGGGKPRLVTVPEAQVMGGPGTFYRFDITPEMKKALGPGGQKPMLYSRAKSDKPRGDLTKLIGQEKRDMAVALYYEGDETGRRGSVRDVAERLGIGHSSVHNFLVAAERNRNRSEAQANADINYGEKRRGRGIPSLMKLSKVAGKGVIHAQSSYEAAFLYALERDPNVTGIKRGETDPVRYRLAKDKGRDLVYKPDITATYKDGSTKRFEVKGAWQANDEKVVAKARASGIPLIHESDIQAYLDHLGIEFDPQTALEFAPSGEGTRGRLAAARGIRRYAGLSEPKPGALFSRAKSKEMPKVWNLDQIISGGADAPAGEEAKPEEEFSNQLHTNHEALTITGKADLHEIAKDPTATEGQKQAAADLLAAMKDLGTHDPKAALDELQKSINSTHAIAAQGIEKHLGKELGLPPAPKQSISQIIASGDVNKIGSAAYYADKLAATMKALPGSKDPVTALQKFVNASDEGGLWHKAQEVLGPIMKGEADEGAGAPLTEAGLGKIFDEATGEKKVAADALLAYMHDKGITDPKEAYFQLKTDPDDDGGGGNWSDNAKYIEDYLGKELGLDGPKPGKWGWNLDEMENSFDGQLSSAAWELKGYMKQFGVDDPKVAIAKLKAGIIGKGAHLRERADVLDSVLSPKLAFNAPPDHVRAAMLLKGYMEDRGIKNPMEALTKLGEEDPDNAEWIHNQLQGKLKEVDAPPSLLVARNLTTEHIKGMAEHGGETGPSIAVFNAKQGFTGFGDITLLGPPSIIDPAGSRYGNRVFGADVYTPRIPWPESAKVDQDHLLEVGENAGILHAMDAMAQAQGAKKYGSSKDMVDLLDPGDGYGLRTAASMSSHLQQQPEVKLAFLNKLGKKVEFVKAPPNLTIRRLHDNREVLEDFLKGLPKGDLELLRATKERADKALADAGDSWDNYEVPDIPKLAHQELSELYRKILRRIAKGYAEQSKKSALPFADEKDTDAVEQYRRLARDDRFYGDFSQPDRDYFNPHSAIGVETTKGEFILYDYAGGLIEKVADKKAAAQVAKELGLNLEIPNDPTKGMLLKKDWAYTFADDLLRMKDAPRQLDYIGTRDAINRAVADGGLEDDFKAYTDNIAKEVLGGANRTFTNHRGEKVAYTPGNIAEHMASQGLRGSESKGDALGLAKLQALGTQRFRTLGEMKQADIDGRLMDEDSFNAAGKKEYRAKLDALREKLKPYLENKGGADQRTMQAIADFYAGGMRHNREARMRAALEKNGFKDVPAEIIDPYQEGLEHLAKRLGNDFTITYGEGRTVNVNRKGIGVMFNGDSAGARDYLSQRLVHAGKAVMPRIREENSPGGIVKYVVLDSKGNVEGSYSTEEHGKSALQREINKAKGLPARYEVRFRDLKVKPALSGDGGPTHILTENDPVTGKYDIPFSYAESANLEMLSRHAFTLSRGYKVEMATDGKQYVLKNNDGNDIGASENPADVERWIRDIGKELEDNYGYTIEKHYVYNADEGDTTEGWSLMGPDGISADFSQDRAKIEARLEQLKKGERDPLPVGEALAFADALHKAPSDYLEAKPLRSVGLSEYRVAIVPKHTDSTTIKTLREHGLDVHTYNGKQHRKDLQLKLGKDLMFQRARPQNAQQLASQLAAARKRQNQLANAVAQGQTAAGKATFLETLSGYLKSTMLSNPGTHGANMLANLLHAAARNAADVPGALLDVAGMHMLGTGMRTTTASPVALGKGMRALFSAKKGTGVDEWDSGAWRKAWEEMSGQSTGLSGSYHRQAPVNWSNPVMKGMELHSKLIFGLLGGEDALFNAVETHRSMYNQALAMAKTEKAQGAIPGAMSTRQRAADLFANPTPEMVDLAQAEALVSTFQNSNALSTGLSDLKSKIRDIDYAGPLLHFAADQLVPFEKTLTNIIAEGFDMAGGGLLKAGADAMRIRERVAAGALNTALGTEEVRRLQRHMSQKGAIGALGTLAMAAMAMGAKGILQKRLDENAKDKTENVLSDIQGSGWTGGKIRVGGRWWDVRGVGPTGAVALAAAAAGDAYRETGMGGRAFSAAMGELWNQIMEHPTMKTMGQLNDIANSEGDDKTNQFLAGMASRTIPFAGALNQAASAMDPLDRKIPKDAGVGDYVKKGIPGMRETLPPRLDKLTGEPQANQRTPFAPFSPTKDRSGEPLIKTLRENRMLPPAIKMRRGEDKATFDARSRATLRGWREAVMEATAQPDYVKLPASKPGDEKRHLGEDDEPRNKREFIQWYIDHESDWRESISDEFPGEEN